MGIVASRRNRSRAKIFDYDDTTVPHQMEDLVQGLLNNEQTPVEFAISACDIAKQNAEKAVNDPDARSRLMRSLQALSNNNVKLRHCLPTNEQRTITISNLIDTTVLSLSPKTVYVATAAANAALCECLSIYNFMQQQHVNTGSPSSAPPFTLTSATIQLLVESISMAERKMKDVKKFRNCSVGELTYVLSVLKESIKAMPKSDGNAELSKGLGTLALGIIKSIATFQPTTELISGVLKTGVALFHKFEAHNQKIHVDLIMGCYSVHFAIQDLLSAEEGIECQSSSTSMQDKLDQIQIYILQLHHRVQTSKSYSVELAFVTVLCDTFLKFQGGTLKFPEEILEVIWKGFDACSAKVQEKWKKILLSSNEDGDKINKDVSEMLEDGFHGLQRLLSRESSLFMSVFVHMLQQLILFFSFFSHRQHATCNMQHDDRW